MSVRTLYWEEGKLYLLDQRLLPYEERYVSCSTVGETATAIKDMAIRGAPAIGVAAAYGLALGAESLEVKNLADFRREFKTLAAELGRARPTAVNLVWAIKRMEKVVADYSGKDMKALRLRLLEKAAAIEAEDVALNEKLGEFGAALFADGDTVLTHCNAGALATAGFGTALGVIRAAVRQGKRLKVFADETRPYLQGARLTAWELVQEGIPVTVICDNMAGHFMSQGFIQRVVVGADRIAANGDTANKIGTLSVAVLAKEFGIPFYIAAPTSTLDLEIADGREIPIEMRDAREISHYGDRPITPPGAAILNPAFDVTPHRYIAAIITEQGVITPPFNEKLTALKTKSLKQASSHRRKEGY